MLVYQVFTTTFLVFTTLLLAVLLNSITPLLPLVTVLFQPLIPLSVQPVPKKISCAKFLLKTFCFNTHVFLNQVIQKLKKLLETLPVSTVMHQVNGLDKNSTWLKTVGVLIGVCKVIL